MIPTPASEQRTARNLSAFGRLRDGVTVRRAEAEMNGIAQQLAAAYPTTNADLTRGLLETITQRFIGGAARVVFPLITAAAGFVLLIACANVANLLLSRSEYRSREIAMRMTLGASRFRVIRQLLLESIVLSAIGGAAGVILAYSGAHAIDASINDPGKPYWIVFTMDHVVLAYVVASCVITGILFGLAPALHISRGNTNEVLKQTGRGMAGSRSHWFSNTMVVLQLSLTIVLLVGAGLTIRSFLNLYTVDLGFSTKNLTAMRLQLPNNKYATTESRQAFFDQLTPRLSAVPGLQGIAVSTSVPGLGSRFGSFEIEGRPTPAPGNNGPSAAIVTITPNLFDVLGVALRRGRTFNETDGSPGAEAAILNERMATMFFPGEDPIGKRLRFGGPDSRWLTIIGISPSLNHASLRNSEIAPAVYAPLRQSPPASFSLLTRTTLLPSSLMSAVRREVQMVDQDQPVFTIQTMDQMLEQERFGPRLSGGLFGIFAAIALVLSAVGLYAVMAYQVTQRTQEIGVRVALGAQTGQISWLILKRGLVQLAIGLALGLAGAFAVSRLLERALFRVTPADPVTFLAITFILTAVALVACVIPARTAARVDPLAAIRME